MTTIFYLFTLVFIGYELLVLFKPYKFRDLAGPIKEYTKTKDITYDFITAILIFVVQLLYLLWAFVGLFSSNYKYFIILLALGMITGPLKRLFKSADIVIIALDAFTSVMLLCIIFINYFA